MSLSTDRFKTYPIGCYCPTPAKARGQSGRHTDRPEFARLKHLLLAARTRVGPGLLTNKLIKEDHLHCVHHKDVWDTYIAGEYQPRLSTRLQPACNRIFRPGHVSTPTRPSSHPRGFRLFTCQRASLLKSYVVNLYRFAAVKLFSPASSGFASSAFPVRLREAESYRSFRRCQSAVAKIFVQPSRVADWPLKQPVPRPTRPLSPTVKPRSAIDFGDKITEEPRPVRFKLEEFFKGVAKATCDPDHLHAAVQTPRADPESSGRNKP